MTLRESMTDFKDVLKKAKKNNKKDKSRTTKGFCA